MKINKSGAQKGSTIADDFAALQQIVTAFEKDVLSLDESLVKFEEGLQLAQRVKKTLEGVEQKIVTLKKKYQIQEKV